MSVLVNKTNFRIAFSFLVFLLIVVYFRPVEKPKIFQESDVLGETAASSPSIFGGGDISLSPILEDSPIFDEKLAPSVSAKSVLVLDLVSGSTIYEKNSHSSYPPASLTKITTALVAIEEYSPDEIVTVPSVCLGLEGNNMGLLEGERVSVADLLRGLLIFSSSDAACALANHIGDPSVFVAEMNTYAIRTGLTDTVYLNPIGLDQMGHVSSAYDIAILSQALLNNDFLAQIVNKLRFQFTNQLGESRPFDNTNLLLGKMPGVTGVKTGYTNQAGGCLSLSFGREGRKLLIVILGSIDYDPLGNIDYDTRFEEAADLVNWAVEVVE